MRITEIHVDGYGIWRDLHLGNVGQSITVIWGRNEAGKSTLMQFLRDMFFDITGDRLRYLPPIDDGVAGGHLGLQTDTADWQLDREWRHDHHGWHSPARWHRSRQDEWTVSAPPAELEHVDRPLFENVFCLGLDDLAELDRLDAATAGELLYSLSTGLDRVTLRQITQRLQAERDELAANDGGKLREFWLRYQAAHSAEEAAATSGTRWITLVSQLAQCEQSLEGLDERRRSLELRVERLGLAVRTAADWHALWRVEQERNDSPLASGEHRERFLKSLQIDRELRRLENHYQRRRHEFRELKQKIGRIEVHAELWGQRRAIESLVDQQARLIWLQARSAGTPSPSPVPTPVSQPQAAATDDGLAPELWSLLQQQASDLESVRAECDRLEALVVESPAESASTTPDDSNLQSELKRVGDCVTLLRRRVQLKQRLDKMVRHRKELQEETETLLEHQVLPNHVLAYLGIPFVVGVMLILGGLFWSTASKLGWPVALLGLAGWVAAVVIKIVLEKSSAQELEEAQEQLTALQRQIETARKEAAGIDEQLPTSSTTLDERLTQAEQQLEALERQLPHTVPQSGVAVPLTSQLEAAYAKRDRAERQWRQALTRCGLAPDLTPEQAAELPVRTTVVTAPVIQVPSVAIDDAARHEYELLAGRIRRFARELLAESDSADPVQLLEQLHRELLQEKKRRHRRHRLVLKARRIRQRAMRLRRRLRRLRRRLADLRAAFAHLTTSQQLDLNELWETHQRLETEHEQRVAKLRDLVGREESWNAVSDLVERHDREELEPLLHQAQRELDGFEQEKGELYETRGRLREQRRQLEAAPEVERCRRQRTQAEQPLKELADRYEALTLSQKQLSELQRRYEHDRQPETLRDASRYFHFLTERQYDRIWTPWDQTCLLVETADGTQRTVEQLSTGTRELLFLALRLAIVAHYARNGIRLPLVLDDVLVNLDRNRCQAACRLLAAFSEEGHQLLFFTCHDHVAAALRDVGASIVSLPGSADIVLSEPLEAVDQTVAELPEPSISETMRPEVPAATVGEDLETEWDEEWDEEEMVEADTEEDTDWDEEGEADEPDDGEYVDDDDEEYVECEEYEEDDEDEYEYDEDEIAPLAESEAEAEEEIESSAEVATEPVEDSMQPEDGALLRRRFTWDSPERWSRGDDEAA